MNEQTKELVVLMTSGADHELSSVGFTIANGGMTAGLRVSVFLTSAAVDLVRKRAVETTQVNPLEPLKALIEDFLRRGGTLWACTPCVKARGYAQEDLIEGVIIAGSSVMHERIKAGAATLSF
jgi:predicted peroxiredoxin